MINNGLIVSCQPLTGDESFYDIEFILRFALAAEYSNASGIRIEGVKNFLKIKDKINIPIIALSKRRPINDLYKRNITPFYEDVEKLANAGAMIIAIDFTFREKCDKLFYQKLVTRINNAFPKIEILADISTIEEAKVAEAVGVNYISSTLTGYTYYTNSKAIPNYEIIKLMQKELNIPFFAEGGFQDNNQIKKAVLYGAKKIVVGTALTRPHVMIEKFNKTILENL